DPAVRHSHGSSDPYAVQDGVHHGAPLRAVMRSRLFSPRERYVWITDSMRNSYVQKEETRLDSGRARFAGAPSAASGGELPKGAWPGDRLARIRGSSAPSSSAYKT